MISVWIPQGFGSTTNRCGIALTTTAKCENSQTSMLCKSCPDAPECAWNNLKATGFFLRERCQPMPSRLRVTRTHIYQLSFLLSSVMHVTVGLRRISSFCRIFILSQRYVMANNLFILNSFYRANAVVFPLQKDEA